MHGTQTHSLSRRIRAASEDDGESQTEAQKLELRARAAGLKLVAPDTLSITRQRRGRGFLYIDAQGRRVTDPAMLQRIRSLAVPPAYRDVRIAAQHNAHLQAIGCDEAGRVQYRYHSDWDSVREERKIERLAAICRALPRIRRRIARDIRQPELGRCRTLAAVVTLVDRTHIRIGCEDYVHSGRARGAATLLKQNVRCRGDRIWLTFRGKGGLPIRCSLQSAALADAVRELGRLKGRRLFQYIDDTGAIRRVSAAEANRYLQEIAGAQITAKDFRTLAATAAAAELLRGIEPAPTKTGRRRQVAVVMKEISRMLANTPAVARKSYVHRKLLVEFREGRLDELFERARPVPLLRSGEAAISALFHDACL